MRILVLATCLVGCGRTEVDLLCDPVEDDVVEIAEGEERVTEPDQLLPFCGARTLVGDLVVVPDEAGLDWKGLNSLSAVETWEGGLWLSVDPIPDVALPELETIGQLQLLQDPSDPPPVLTSLEVVQGRFAPGAYAGQLDVSSLRSARSLDVRGDMDLSSLEELYTFTVGNDLRSLPEAPLLTRMVGGVSVGGELEDLAMLRNVTQLGGLEITSRELSSLEDLSNLEQIGPRDTSGTATATATGLAIRNTALTDLSGLEGVTAVQGHIEVRGNEQLTSLRAFSPLAWLPQSEHGDVETRLEVEGEPAFDSRDFDWLERVEVPKPCRIEVSVAPLEAERLAALCF